MRIMLLGILPVLLVGAEPDRVPWSRTPEAFAGKTVVVRLTSGTTIEGHWASVTQDSFSMRVEDTSNKSDISKGLQTLPRSSIQSIRARRRRARGRVIGGLVGYVCGNTIGVRAGSAGAWSGAIIGGTFAGLVVGTLLDHATREVILVPDQP